MEAEAGSGTAPFRASLDQCLFTCAWGVESAAGSKIIDGQSFRATLGENKPRIDYES